MGKTNNIHQYFYYTVIVLIGLLFFPRLADFGLFMDGSIYGTVAHNMAIGDGSFWQPMFHNYYALVGVNSAIFYEHPPLMFWIQSWFFKLFGDGFYVENFYGVIILLLHILTITFFFKDITKSKYSIFAVWPVLLLWYFVPTILWSTSQNMLDNTLSLWTLLSVWASYRAVRKDHFLWAILAGVLMGLAVLTKGPLGFFPLTAIALLWLANFWTKPTGSYSFYRAFYKSIAVVAGFGIVVVNIMTNPKGKVFMLHYIKQQVIPSVTGQKEIESTLTGHLSILKNMLIEFSPIYGVAILLWILFHFFRKEHYTIKNKTIALWLIFVGLSATMPIALSAKSHSFYLISSVPYFAMAVGIYWIDSILSLTQKVILARKNKRTWRVFLTSIVLFTIVSTSVQWGKYHRDGSMLKDLDALSEKVNPMDTIGIEKGLLPWATLHSNLERHHLLYTSPHWTDKKTVLVKKQVGTSFLDSLTQKGFRPVPGAWEAFLVYKK